MARRSGSGGTGTTLPAAPCDYELAESSEASKQTIMAIAGHVSRKMLEHYSHIRQDAKRLEFLVVSLSEYYARSSFKLPHIHGSTRTSDVHH
jgi:hypothetical protein